MRWDTKLFFGIIILYLCAIVVANRGIFFSRFDATYWKDKYDHSQWGLPLSVRTIGDDGLYLYEGYRLTTGGDTTLLNAEVPPLGKYLIGAVVRLFGNGHWFGFVTNLSLLLLFYLLAKKIFPSGALAIALTAMLATDPLITDQYTLTMLDALQSVWLLAFLYYFVSTTTKQRKSWTLFISGVCLGFFGETKFPLFLPIPIGLVFFSLFRTKNWVRQSVLFASGIAAGYLVPYIPYFFSGHSIIEWLRIQKWVVAFYTHSKLTPTYGSAITNLLVGSFQNIYSRLWLAAPHWSPVWTLVMFGAAASYSRAIIKNTLWRNIFILALCILAVYTIIPFWTRYLVLLLPLVYLLFGFFLTRIKYAVAIGLTLLCVVVNMGASFHHFFPTAEGTVSLFTYNWNNHFFQDMYEDLDSATKSTWKREEFRTRGMHTILEGEIEKAEVTYTFPAVSLFATRVDIPAKVTYVTRHLGSFDFQTTIPLQKENNRWKVRWDWNMYLPDMTNRTHLATTVQEAKRGSIIASDKSILASDIPSFMIWITPLHIVPDEEKQLLQLLEKIFGRTIQAVYFHQRLYGNALSELPVPIGVIPKILKPEELKELTSYHGVSLTPHAGRFAVISDFTKIGTVANSQYFECCSYLYTTTTYDGVDGVEKEKNEQLKGINGGTLVLMDAQNNILRTLIQRERKNGVDVQP